MVLNSQPPGAQNRVEKAKNGPGKPKEWHPTQWPTLCFPYIIFLCNKTALNGYSDLENKENEIQKV